MGIKTYNVVKTHKKTGKRTFTTMRANNEANVKKRIPTTKYKINWIENRYTKGKIRK